MMEQHNSLMHIMKMQLLVSWMCKTSVRPNNTTMTDVKIQQHTRARFTVVNFILLLLHIKSAMYHNNTFILIYWPTKQATVVCLVVKKRYNMHQRDASAQAILEHPFNCVEFENWSKETVKSNHINIDNSSDLQYQSFQSASRQCLTNAAKRCWRKQHAGIQVS